MKYTLYKITNTINDKIYVGVHKTDDINDDYMGSGTILKRAIKKYGIENFTKEILEVYDNPEDMFDAEAKIVNEEFVKRDDNYNLKEGGSGGWDHINDGSEEHINHCINGGRKGGKAWKEKFFHLMENDDEFYLTTLKNLAKGGKAGRARIKELYPEGSWKGKRHNEDSKKKIGEANSIHQKGKGNSQYGTRWIHNLDLKKSKRIKKEEVLPEGWLEGRKIKF